ncbi:UDP-glucose:glycoprotein glucosyltransferase 2 [Aphanomyces cochlioides]|nr:UDP-glucose:glycoprotein glucosyltransferase 2 [Aphanomyces cochlioides]
MRMTGLSPFLGLACAYLGLVDGHRHVQVNLTTPYLASPLFPVLETSEFLSQEDPKLFYSYIDAVQMRFQAIRDKDAVNYTRIALEAAGDVLPDQSSVARMLPFVLETRAYSPAVEMFNQLAIESAYKSCPNQTVEAWAIIYREIGCADYIICDIKEFTDAMLEKRPEDEQSTCAASGQHDFQFHVDHVYPSLKLRGSTQVIVYGAVTTPAFQAFHSKFLPLAVSGDIGYIVRHAPQGNTLPVLVQGYGVSLNIKNMEYKTIDDSKETKAHSSSHDDEEDDFIVSVMTKKTDQVGKALREYQKEFEDAEDEGAEDEEENSVPWQLSELGYLATEKILADENPLKRLQLISQDFPKYAASLALTQTRPSPENITEIKKARAQVISKRLHNRIVVNGLAFDFNEYGFNAFDYLKTLSKELRLADTLKHVDPSGAIKAALSSLASQKEDVRVAVRGTVDGLAPLYLNSIETDEDTKDWSTDMSALRGPSWNLIFLRKVMYEIILVVDPTTYVGVEAMRQVNYLRMRQAPVQFGVLWTSPEFLKMSREERQTYIPTTDEKAPATVFHVSKLFYAARKRNTEAGDQLLRELYSLNGDVTVKEILLMYSQAVGERYSKDDWLEEAKKVMLSENNEVVWAMTDLVLSKNLPLNSHLFNGVVQTNLNIQEGIMGHFGRDQAIYQALVREDVITDDSDMLNELLASEGAYSIYCPWFDSDFIEPKHSLNWKDLAWQSVGSFHAAGTAQKPKRQNILLFANLDKHFGAQSAYQALRSIADYPDLRLSIIHNGKDGDNNSLGKRMAYILSQLGHTDSPVYRGVVLEILRMMGKKTPEEVLTHSRLFLQLHLDANPEDAVLPQIGKWLVDAPIHVNPFRNLVDDEHLILINGRPLDLEDSPLTAHLLDGLIQFEANSRSKTVSKAYVSQFKHDNFSVEEAAEKSHALYHVMEMVDEYLKTPRVSPVFSQLNPAFSYHTNDSENAIMDIIAYLDPLSETAQRASGILRMLESVLGAKITLVLLPSHDYEEFPLKRFYRFLWGTGTTQTIHFNNLPRQPVLTMNLETPESWNVQMIKSDTDVDNIQRNASATYYIKDVLVYGQCMDRTMPHYPSLPNGLQLVLERTAATQHFHKDTVVMKNLGYFQLQAAPGVWQLHVAKGRHASIYELMLKDSRVESVPVVVYDFLSSIMQLEVKKRVGQESAHLLDDSAISQDEEEEKKSDEDKSYWSSLMNWGKPTPATVRKGDTIHVFSLATGHLYERMLKLMMLSVLKRTKNPVTFWLLENFLSPDFKNSVPALQAEFGMDIRLVTYKWPNWLRRQTEKQRIIWGYKILFLDVLFPLGVEKIIYVDADQIVRADLNELWTMDLQGRPYGYTPFCDSRNVGFQFWRQGYWKDHLRGKPYHISALYVVDLVKFKRMAAGDTLRAIYDQLSADPNSLSNLDQDLPNYAQHQIPIFSLPQEWLWCESWCSDETKENAKTIDLCNNPKHKEPKLDMAKRVISGDLFPESWLELDSQVKAAEARYAQTATA